MSHTWIAATLPRIGHAHILHTKINMCAICCVWSPGYLWWIYCEQRAQNPSPVAS